MFIVHNKEIVSMVARQLRQTSITNCQGLWNTGRRQKTQILRIRYMTLEFMHLLISILLKVDAIFDGWCFGLWSVFLSFKIQQRLLVSPYFSFLLEMLLFTWVCSTECQWTVTKDEVLSELSDGNHGHWDHWVPGVTDPYYCLSC